MVSRCLTHVLCLPIHAMYDELHSDDEDRYQVIGHVKGIIFVVYTERGDATRLISARYATASERRMYNGDT